MPTGHENSLEEFWSLVDKSDGEDACWIWTGRIGKSGSPFYCLKGYSDSGHGVRVAYIFHYGSIPFGMSVYRKCYNKLCCNPKHLYISRGHSIINSDPSVLWRKVDKSGGDDLCWNWLGCIDAATGYGKVSCFGKKNWSPHRLAYFLMYGDIPDGMFVCHKCDNRICCNPKHLFIGTSDDNINDMISKGRNPRGSKVGTSVLREEDVIKIKEMLSTKKFTHKEIGEMFGVKKVTISAINSNRNWAWV